MGQMFVHFTQTTKTTISKTKSGIDDQWQADLVNMSSLATFNDKHTVIDVFTKVCYARPLRNKEACSIVDAFKHILTHNEGNKPLFIQMDKENFVINMRGRSNEGADCGALESHFEK